MNTHANLFVSYTNFTNNCKTHVQYMNNNNKKKKIPWGLKKICWGLINITVPRVSYKPHSISISIFSFNFPVNFCIVYLPYLNLSTFRAIYLIVFMLFVTIVVVFPYCLHLIHNLSRCLSLYLVSISFCPCLSRTSIKN